MASSESLRNAFRGLVVLCFFSGLPLRAQSLEPSEPLYDYRFKQKDPDNLTQDEILFFERYGVALPPSGWPKATRPFLVAGYLQPFSGFVLLDAVSTSRMSRARLVGGPTLGLNTLLEVQFRDSSWIPGMIVELDQWTLSAPVGKTLDNSNFWVYGLGASVSRRGYFLAARWNGEFGLAKRFAMIAPSASRLGVVTPLAPFLGLRARWAVPRRSSTQWFVEASARYVTAKRTAEADVLAGTKIKAESGFAFAWRKDFRTVVSGFLENYNNDSAQTKLSVSRLGMALRMDFFL